MKNKTILIIVFFIYLFGFEDLIAQDWVAGENITLNVSSYALIESNYAPVNLTLTTTTPGEAVTSVSNSDLYVKVSSITPGSTDREISARISSGVVPNGTSLTLVSADCTTSNSGGAVGYTIGTPITLSTTDQLLVTNIGTCYTGTGYNDGYQMTFNWELVNPNTDYDLLASDTYNITVVFTLAAHDGN